MQECIEDYCCKNVFTMLCCKNGFRVQCCKNVHKMQCCKKHVYMLFCRKQGSNSNRKYGRFKGFLAEKSTFWPDSGLLGFGLRLLEIRVRKRIRKSRSSVHPPPLPPFTARVGMRNCSLFLQKIKCCQQA